MQLKPILGVFREQISHLFIVNFEVRCAHQELSLVGVICNGTEDVIKGAWHYTTKLLVTDHTCHRMRFARARLAVSKDGTIVALKDVGDDGCRRFFIDLALCDAITVCHIECKLLGRFGAEGPLQDDFTARRFNIDDLGVALAHLLFIDWPATNGNLDCLIFLRNLDFFGSSTTALATFLNHLYF